MIKNVDKKDLRIEHTRKKLSQALIRLLQQEAFHDISVSSLCKEAGVSRATFYNNFDSVDDILPYYFNQRKIELQRLLRDKLSNLGISLEDAYRSLVHEIIVSLNEDYYPVFQSVIKRNDSSHINQIVQEFIFDIVGDFANTYLPEVHLTVTKDFLASVLAGAITGALIYLYRNKDAFSTDERVDAIFAVTWYLLRSAYPAEKDLNLARINVIKE